MEVWKNVVGYEGVYQVSNYGRVKSLHRIGIDKTGRKLHTPEKIRKLTKNYQGYMLIRLFMNNEGRSYYVHRLVMSSFVGILHGKDYVNHKNGIKDDNRLENLEWVTFSENQKHAYIMGLKKPPNQRGENHSRSVLTEEIVRQLRIDYQSIKNYSHLARLYKINKATIRDAVVGKNWSHVE